MRTGRHDEADSRFSQFCERAYKVKVSVRAPGRRVRSGGVTPRIVKVIRLKIAFLICWYNVLYGLFLRPHEIFFILHLMWV